MFPIIFQSNILKWWTILRSSLSLVVAQNYLNKQMFAGYAQYDLIDNYWLQRKRQGLLWGEINVTLMRKAGLLSKDRALFSSKCGNNGSLMHLTPFSKRSRGGEECLFRRQNKAQFISMGSGKVCWLTGICISLRKK